MQTIKTALVGFGISGQCFQAPVIQYCDRFELVAVVSSDEAKVKAQLPDVQVMSFDQVLADAEIELVVLATPNQLHAPQAELALKAGKHVVVEKPFTITSGEGEHLLEVARQCGRHLTVYQSRRFDGDFRTIQELRDNKQLDGIHTFYSSYNRYRPEVKVRWREQDIPGAGILYDLGAHLIDQALCLFGLPDRVTATLRAQRPGAQAVDHFHLILHYPHCEAILHANCLSTAEGPRFQVFASNGSFIKYGMDTQEDLLRDKIGPESPQWGRDKPDNHGQYTDASGKTQAVVTMRGGYEAFYQQLAQAIREDGPLPVAAEEALDVIKVIEAAYLSCQQQRSVDIL